MRVGNPVSLLFLLSFTLFSLSFSAATNMTCTSQCVAFCSRNDSCTTAKDTCLKEVKAHCDSATDPAVKAICKKDPCGKDFKTCQKNVKAAAAECKKSCILNCKPLINPKWTPGRKNDADQAETEAPEVNSSEGKSMVKRGQVIPGDDADLSELKALWAEISGLKAQYLEEVEYCYKDVYTRGSRMADCPWEFVNDGATCRRPTDDYGWPSRMADCPPDYHNIGLLCSRPDRSYWKCCTVLWAACPCEPGFVNMGCHCAKFASALGMDAMTCNRPGEWKFGARCYAPCRPGYVNTGETCHRPLVIHGLDSMTCRTGEERVGGRCYPLCRAGFGGLLEQCWANCPAGWTSCGLSCHKGGVNGCVEEIGNQILNGILAAGSVAAIIFSGGLAAPATKAAHAARWAASATKGRNLINSLIKFEKTFSKIEGVYEKGSIAATMGQEMVSESSKFSKFLVTANAIVNGLDLVDPTGLFGLARSLMAPKCHEMEESWVAFVILG